MQLEKQGPYTFIVRLWREEGEDAAFIWRGSVDCVQTGERVYFQSLEKIGETISSMAGDSLTDRQDGIKTG